jgi:hypothetical protein
MNESKADGTDELRLADDDTSRPAGLEKFIAALFDSAAELEGSANVPAKLETSTEAKLGMGGIVGTADSGESGLLPDGLSAVALLAALCA